YRRCWRTARALYRKPRDTSRALEGTLSHGTLKRSRSWANSVLAQTGRTTLLAPRHRILLRRLRLRLLLAVCSEFFCGFSSLERACSDRETCLSVQAYRKVDTQTSLAFNPLAASYSSRKTSMRPMTDRERVRIENKARAKARRVFIEGLRKY